MRVLGSLIRPAPSPSGAQSWPRSSSARAHFSRSIERVPGPTPGGARATPDYPGTADRRGESVPRGGALAWQDRADSWGARMMARLGDNNRSAFAHQSAPKAVLNS